MLNRFLIFAMFVVFSQGALAQQAAQAKAPPITPVIIRGDGMVVDKQGLIRGIRNKADPRGNEKVFYYFGVDKKGNVSRESQFKVFQNPKVTVPDFVQQSVVPYDPENPTFDGTEAKPKSSDFEPSTTGVYEFGEDSK